MALWRARRYGASLVQNEGLQEMHLHGLENIKKYDVVIQHSVSHPLCV